MPDSDIKAKLLVDGLAKFKGDMQAGSDSVKTFSAKLKENEAQYKLTGDAETYMTNKTKLLQQQIAEQEKVVQAARESLELMQKNGVDPASKAYQDMERQVSNASTKLLDMQTSLRDVGNAAGDASKKAQDMDADVHAIGLNVNYETVIRAIDNVTGAMERGAKKAWEFARDCYNASVDASVWADDLITESTQTGIDTTTLQRWKYAERFIDTETGTIESSMTKLLQQMDSAKEGTGAAAEAFTKLGVVVTDTTTGKLRDTQQVFWECITALGAMGDSSDANTAAMDIFGKKFQELKPLIEAGHDEFQRVAESAPVLSEKAVDSLGKLNDAVQELDAQKQNLMLQLWSDLSPVMEKVTGYMADFTKTWNEWMTSEEGQKAMESLNKALGDLIDEAGKHLPDAMKTATDVAGKIVEWLQWTAENSDIVIKAVEGIAIAYGGLKLSSAFLKGLQLIKSIQWLNASRAAKDIASALSGGAIGTAASAASAGQQAATATTAASGGIMSSLASIGSQFIQSGAGPFAVVSAALGAVLSQAAVERDYGEVNETRENMDALLATTADTTAELRAMQESLAQANEAFSQIYSEGAWAAQQFVAGNYEDVKAAAPDIGIWERLETAAENAGVSVQELIKNIDDYNIEITAASWDDALKAYIVSMGERIKEAQETGKQVPAGYAEGMAENVDVVKKAADDVGDAGIQALEDASGVQSPSVYGHDIGYNIDLGLANGILDGQSEVVNAAAQVAAATIAQLQRDLEINSPSRVMFELGGYVSEGFADGISQSVSMVRGAVSGMTRATTRAVRGGGQADSQASLANMLARALSKATVSIDGQLAGAVIAPTVDQILGAAFARR